MTLYDSDASEEYLLDGRYVIKPLVRCKDCKHYDKGTIFPCGIASDFIVGDDDYCSSAERREEDG